MRISVRMALDSLSEQVEAVTLAERVLGRERAIRDDLIRDAHQSKVPMRVLIQTTGLSRDRIYTIANSPSQTYLYRDLDQHADSNAVPTIKNRDGDLQ